MNDRKTASTINDNQLDELYRRIETLEHVAAGNKRHVQLIVPELERAEATIASVRALRDDLRGITGARWIADALDNILGEEPAPTPGDTAATQATDPEQQPLILPRDMATTLHRALGQLLGDQDAQAIARIRALHTNEYESCSECTHEFSVAWPCPTITALDQPKEQH